MPMPQYNVNMSDTGSKNYYNIVSYNKAPTPQPRVNPLKNWWNNIVNQAKANAYAPVNIWDTVAPSPPKFNTSTEGGMTTLWDGFKYTPPTPMPTRAPGYSIFDPFGVNERVRLGTLPARAPGYSIFDPFGVNERVRLGTLPARAPAPRSFTSPIRKPSQIPNGQYADTDDRNRVLSWEEIAKLPGYGIPPQPVDDYPYQDGVWVPDQELLPAGGWGGWGGWGGGGGGYTAMPSSPGYRSYGGGYNPSGAPRSAYYQGRNGGYGSGYGGYAGGQSQRGAWYGALLQWNI